MEHFPANRGTTVPGIHRYERCDQHKCKVMAEHKWHVLPPQTCIHCPTEFSGPWNAMNTMIL